MLVYSKEKQGYVNRENVEAVIVSALRSVIPCARENTLVEIEGLKPEHFENPRYREIFESFLDESIVFMDFTAAEETAFKDNWTHLHNLRWYCLKLMEGVLEIEG